ncbi:cytochrome P450 [Favolaschia claudopus]|uniref:Cytochrome P450 n=1 Tax=Favolaschia claudopus TaxID=2862362 RepID=A0AAW0D8U2_9AGAR
MPSTKSFVLFLALGLQLVSALPLEGRDEMAIVARKTTNKATAAATNGNGATKAKTSTAKDGSTIVDQTVKINGLNMRFKVSAPASELVSGGAAGTGKLGLNVLFHGDGGQSFLDFPNQGVQNGLMGVALLSPDQGRRWGGSDPKDNTGLVRPDGPAHSAAVNELLTKVLPTVVNFDASQIFMEGVSGGSLLLSGFMIPTFGASLAVPGAVLGCGGLTPQVQVQGDISNMRLHFQSTTDDLGSLKKSIPQAITAYEKLITDPTLLTADASPNGGHCEFDEKDFVSGVQLLTDNFNSILTNTNPVAHSVVGKENIYAANAIKPQGSIADGAAKQQQAGGAAAAAGGAAQKASPKAANAGQGAAAGGKAAALRNSNKLIKDIPGPPSKSWLFGNMLEIILEVPYGVYVFAWQKTYGMAFRTKGCFGENRLMISDPETIKHMLSHPATYMKSRQQQLVNETGLGPGSLLFVEGEAHRRIRAVMNPAFSAASIRQLGPTLRKAAREISEVWEAILTSQKSDVLDIYPSLHETTLRAVGEGVVGYNFQADKEFAARYHNLVVIAADRSKASVLTDGILPYISKPIMNVLLSFPPPAVMKLLEFKAAIGTLAKKLIKDKMDALELGVEPEKDLISVLVGSNSESTSKMTFEEIKDQFATITVAGEDTTANTVAWSLYELARNPDLQTKLRAELDEAGPSDTVDYDRLPILNALLKEILRLYSTVPQTERVVAKDSVLPLSEPITTISGKVITEIPVKKGQHIVIAISSYHRLKSVWGEDAEEFKPSRWLDGNLPSAGTSLGPYSNLLSFLGGSRTCIGWRFSISEMQIIVSELVRKFSLAIPDDSKVQRTFAITLVPMTDGRPRLPLRVSRLL